MELVIYQVDAFATLPGNPAAVAPLPLLAARSVAAKHCPWKITCRNCICGENRWDIIRWFATKPQKLISAAATLATTAYVLMNHERIFSKKDHLQIQTDARPFPARNQLVLDFWQIPRHQRYVARSVAPFISYKTRPTFSGVRPTSCSAFENESQIKKPKPDLDTPGWCPVAAIDCYGARRQNRFCIPFLRDRSLALTKTRSGSAHTSRHTRRTGLASVTCPAIQCSSRGGRLDCVLRGDRVEIAGRAKSYLIGKIFIDYLTKNTSVQDIGDATGNEEPAGTSDYRPIPEITSSAQQGKPEKYGSSDPAFRGDGSRYKPGTNSLGTPARHVICCGTCTLCRQSGSRG